ncbi:MAG: rubredoxin [Desulforhopalus sp.]
MKTYRCNLCGYVYDPAVGDTTKGVAPGTPFDELPEDWCCLVCGVAKDNFTEKNEFSV